MVQRRARHALALLLSAATAWSGVRPGAAAWAGERPAALPAPAKAARLGRRPCLPRPGKPCPKPVRAALGGLRRLDAGLDAIRLSADASMPRPEGRGLAAAGVPVPRLLSAIYDGRRAAREDEDLPAVAGTAAAAAPPAAAAVRLGPPARSASAARAEWEVREKAAQSYDAAHARTETARLQRLDHHRNFLSRTLGPLPDTRGADPADLSPDAASASALADQLGRWTAAAPAPAAALPDETRAKLEGLAGELEALNAQLKSDVELRDAAQVLLAASEEALNQVLRALRSGQEMRRLHTDLARVAAVTDYKFALNIIAAANEVKSRMLALLESRRQAILQSLSQNQKDQGAAQAGLDNIGAFRRQLSETIAGDQTLRELVVLNEAEAGMAARSVRSFQAAASALIAKIDAADRGVKGSPDALAEYRRRLALLPDIARCRADGGAPCAPTAFSLKQFRDYAAVAAGDLRRAQEGLPLIPSVPVQTAGVLVIEIPGPPERLVTPNHAVIRDLLNRRRIHWREKAQPFLDAQATLRRMTDASNPNLLTDEFGDRYPESLPVWATQSRRLAADAESAARRLLVQLDADAARINAVSGAGLPPLAGRSLLDLQNELQPYADRLARVALPASNADLNVFTAKMSLIEAAQLLPAAADQVAIWSQNQAVADAIDEGLRATVPTIQNGLDAVVRIFEDIQTDIDADVAFNETGAGGGRALIERKTALLRDKIIRPLEAARDSLLPALVAFQEKSIAQASPGGDLEKLYNAKLALMNSLLDVYRKTMPWALASFGSTTFGDAGSARASLAVWRQALVDNLDGYTDAQGPHKGVRQFLADVEDRATPGLRRSSGRVGVNGDGTREDVFGENQPYSLPDKKAAYGAELADRVRQINEFGAQVNQILDKVSSLLGGAGGLAALALPVGLGTDPASQAQVQALADGRLRALIDRLEALTGQAGAGGSNLGLGPGNGAVPSGVQPSPTAPPGQQAALTELEGLKRLLPTDLTRSPVAVAVTRYLYCQGVIAAADDALAKVPRALPVLRRILGVLEAALAETGADLAYVDSNGAGETPEALYARKAALFGGISEALVPVLDLLSLKRGWDEASFSTIDKVQTYYGALNEIYAGGQSVNAGQLRAIAAIESAVKSAFADLDKTAGNLRSWLAQLNPREQSAYSRVAADAADLLDQTIAELQVRAPWRALKDQAAAWDQILQADLLRADAKRRALADLRDAPAVRAALPPDLARRLAALAPEQDVWAVGDERGRPAAVAVRKSAFSQFLDALLGRLRQNGQALSAEAALSLKSGWLKDPRGALAALLPGAGVMDFGGGPDGFYLVYESRFSVPHGLETGTWVALRNLVRLGSASTLSVSGYHFASPPSPDGSNAGYGDGGVEVELASHGRKTINYLTVGVHRFANDLPASNTVKAAVQKNRLFILDRAAALLLDDRLVFGAVGYADIALKDAGGNPYYYGGNVKLSFALDKTIRLNAEQRAFFVSDPRRFLEVVNFSNFSSGFDQSLNQDFVIAAKGGKARHVRGQYGASADLSRGGDAFTLDLYYASTSGSDDINQGAGGVSVLKGFTLRDAKKKEWLRVSNRLTGESGARAGLLRDSLSLVFPGPGIALDAQGQIIGAKSSYYAQVSRSLNDQSALSVGYGAQAVGLNNRLQLTLNTSFSLRQAWEAAAGRAARDLQGGAILDGFDADLAAALPKAAGGGPSVEEILRVLEKDVARRLLAQGLGRLAADIQDLRKAGALLDNTRTRAVVGFVSKAVSKDPAELAVGGGFTAGTYTELTLTRAQKRLLEAKTVSLCREGLLLQDRLLELFKGWSAAAAELARAQWERRLAEGEARGAASRVLRAEAEVRLAQARSREHRALLDYDALTGRDPAAGPPFADLSPEDLRRLLDGGRALLAPSGALTKVLGRLDPKALEAALGPAPFSLLDWLPWVERLSAGVGVQIRDLLANQAFTGNLSVRLPFYDPVSRWQDKAYALESRAAIAELMDIYRRRRLDAAAEAEGARLWAARAQELEPDLAAAAAERDRARRAYLNGGGSADDARRAEAAWRRAQGEAWEAQAQAGLDAARQAADAAFDGAPPPAAGPAEVASLAQAVGAALPGGHGLAAAGLRAQAAEAMARADDRGVRRAVLDARAGAGFTATGLGWLPRLGLTGVPVTPVLGLEFQPEELRELQVREHSRQRGYYEALKDGLEAGLAAQIYQSAVAARAAEERLRLYDQAAGASPSPEARRGRAQAARERARAAATLNVLLGRAADAPLAVSLDPARGLEELRVLLKAKDPAASQRAVLDARVDAARAVERIVDMNLKVQTLELEPVSIVMRALGRLTSLFSGGPGYDPAAAAAARLRVLSAEREREAYDGRRRAQAGRLRAELAAAAAELGALDARGGLEARLERSRLEAARAALQAGLLALGEDPASAQAAGAAPRDWDELERRLGEAEAALAPLEDSFEEAAGAASAPGGPRWSGSSRLYSSIQTLGREPIKQDFVEGWIELRLSDPGTPPERLLKLAELRAQREERAARARRDAASLRGRALAAGFAGDVRLLRWAEAALRERGGRAPELASLRGELSRRLGEERGRLALLLGLPADAPLDHLVPPDPAGSVGPRALASRLIAEIRGRQLGALGRLLFEDGLPPGLGAEDLLGQLRADVVARRMSWRGVTPALAIGMFRGQTIAGAFLEVPDPRGMERGLEALLSSSLRRQLESEGRLDELSRRLRGLLIGVQDGARELEARRRLVESAEADLRARAALAEEDAAGAGAGRAAAELAAAQGRLAAAWLGLGGAAAEGKTRLVALVAELQALSEDGTALRLAAAAPAGAQDEAAGEGPRERLLDFWTDRLSGADFEQASDGALARFGAADADRAAVRAAAADYRGALGRARDARRANGTAGERLVRLERIDAGGRRQALRAELERVLDALGGLDASAPASAGLAGFFRAEAEKVAAEGALGHARARAAADALRERAWAAARPSPAQAAAFRRLDRLAGRLEDARQALLAAYLARGGDDPSRFVAADARLDAALRAQSDLDEELIAALESAAFAGDKGMIARLDELYHLRAAVERERVRAVRGRGLAAVDELTRLQRARLAAARRGERPPDEVAAAAEALQSLREARARWLGGASGAEPVYAVTRLEDGRRTWRAARWLTQSELSARLEAGRADALAKGAVLERGGRWFIDNPNGAPGARYEVIGGADAAAARRGAAARALGEDRRLAARDARMRGADFVAADGARSWSFAEVFGPGGLSEQGRLLFFERVPSSEGGSQAALAPADALSRPPEQFVLVACLGAAPPPPGRWPTLQSLLAAPEAGDFPVLLVSPGGAEQLAAAARRAQAASERRGWIEVKARARDGGFARDESGRVVRLYAARAEFEAERRAFDAAPRALAKAESVLAKARERAAADRKNADAAQAALERAAAAIREGGKAPAAQAAFDRAASADREAARRWRLADAQEVNAASAAQAAAQTLQRSRTWTLYRGADLTLSLDAAGAVNRAVAPAVRAPSGAGAGDLDVAVGGGGAEAERLSGPLAAAAVSEDGRLLRRWSSDAEVAAAAPSWTLRAYDGGGETDAVSDGALRLKTRLAGYEADVDGRRVPVLLSARYAARRRDRGRSRLDAAGHWAVLPRNWLNLLLELPRGVAQLPMEVLGGRDPDREGFRGLAALARVEGGATRHRGALERAAMALDLFGLFADRAEPFFDPSQFPDAARVGSPLRPGEIMAQKSPRSAADGRDLHFGAAALLRAVREADEDLRAELALTLGRFSGAVSEVVLETRRGRAGPYLESRVRVRSGSADPDEGSAAARLPGLFVSGVRRLVSVLPGVEGWSRRAAALDGYGGRVEADAAARARARPGLERDVKLGEQVLAEDLSARAAAEARVPVSGGRP